MAPGGSTEGGRQGASGGGAGKNAAQGGTEGEDGSLVRSERGEMVRGRHGHPGPRAEQMSGTTCFLTPVRVLVTPRMEPAEKFMTLEASRPPSKTVVLPPPSLCLPSLCRFSLLHITGACSATYT